MMSGGQFERLIRKGQILAFEPDLFVRVELVLWYFTGYPIERRSGLFPSLGGGFHAFFHSGVHCFSAPSVVQSREVA